MSQTVRICTQKPPRTNVQYIKARKRNTQAEKGNKIQKTGKETYQKYLRNKGKEYLSATGKTVAARKVQGHNCTKCRFK